MGWEDYPERIPCLKCGEWYDLKGYPPADGLCPRCHTEQVKARVLWKYAVSGEIPESRRRRGRKAYYTRMARKFYSDREEFERLVAGKSPAVRAQITRRINEIGRVRV